MSGLPQHIERRRQIERRRPTLAAFWIGARQPRRREGRRASDQFYPIVDWHSPRVLGLVLGIIGLSIMDGALTLVLLENGASEINPIMAMFLPHNVNGFAAIKLALTGVGTCVLAACSRMKLFRTVSIEAVLHAIVLCYAVLIAYELRLLDLVA